MATSSLLEREIREDNLAPCYVLYGEETYLADRFVDEVRSVLLSPEGVPLDLERFDLEETRWAEILDVAKTAPFFFAPWRILLVTGKEDAKKKPAPSEMKKDAKKKAADAEEKMIREYCKSPAQRTVLIVVIPGKVKKGQAQLRPFESLPAGAVDFREMKPLKGAKLTKWVEANVRRSGKVVTAEAQKKLVDIVGGDLRLLDSELQKLLTYAADKRVIEADDVTEVCDWGREFAAWELVDCLEKTDPGKSLDILHHLFSDGAAPEYVLGTVASLFRDLLLARLWLREGQDRKEIFRTLRPKIQEFWSDYDRLFRGFFDLVERSNDDEIRWEIGELERIDTLIKTSVVPAEAMISAFVIDYCRRRRRPSRGPEATSGNRG